MTQHFVEGFMRILKIFNGIIVSIFLLLMASSIYITAQNIAIDTQLQNFMSREVISTRVISFTVSGEIKTITYYRVALEDGEISKPLFTTPSDPYFGKKGDILITNENPFAYDRNNDGRFDVDPPFMLGSFLTAVWGGHVVLVSEDNGSKIIHAVGSQIGLVGSEQVKAVRIDQNRWHNLTGEIVGVRVKKATPEDYNNAVEQAATFLGQDFNYSLIFDRQNKKGCTDLVFQAFKQAGFHLDYDRGPVSGTDLIISPNTYIYLYAFTDASGNRHIYHT
jgi:uncharacterized protein YycO